jgi:uncharacterized protein YbbK (DUF523 family)/uncharacterized protein YbgA (DUF1722 family)
MTTPPPVRIGISRCLLGDAVRYDGGHKLAPILLEGLGPRVEWLPVCPEVEAGFGVPREPMRLVGLAKAPRVITVATGLDQTRQLERFSRRRVKELASCDLSGYVFKARSPSCGVRDVPLYNARTTRGRPSRKGTGLFARAFIERFPLLPVEEEDRLTDPLLLARFMERVQGYAGWRRFTRSRVTGKGLADFHARHRYLLLAHSRPHCLALDRLVNRVAREKLGPPGQIVPAYGRLFMAALAVPATPTKHVRVLREITERFNSRLSADEGRRLSRALADYRRGLVPLTVPLALVAHSVRRFRLNDPALQAYLHQASHPSPHRGRAEKNRSAG